MDAVTKPTFETTLAPHASAGVKRSARLDPAITERIERLGELNDTFKQALGARDKKTLRDLAKQYQQIGCPRLAGAVRRQARSC